MAKKDDRILAGFVNKETYKTETVVKSGKVYAVCYDDDLIQLKSGHYLTEERSREKKTIFTSSAHAVRLAKRLNRQFKTDKFTVRQLGDGIQIYSQEQKGTD